MGYSGKDMREAPVWFVHLIYNVLISCKDW